MTACQPLVAVLESEEDETVGIDPGSTGAGAAEPVAPTARPIAIEIASCARCDRSSVHVIHSDAAGERLGHWLATEPIIEVQASDGDAVTVAWRGSSGDPIFTTSRVRPQVERLAFEIWSTWSEPSCAEWCCLEGGLGAPMALTVKASGESVLVEHTAKKVGGDSGWLGEDGEANFELAACLNQPSILLKVGRQVGINGDPEAFELRQIPYEPGTSRTEVFALEDNPRLSMQFDLVSPVGSTEVRLRHDWHANVGSSWHFSEVREAGSDVVWEGTPAASLGPASVSAEVSFLDLLPRGFCGSLAAVQYGASGSLALDLNELAVLVPTMNGGWESTTASGGPGTVVEIDWLDQSNTVWSTRDDPSQASEPAAFPDLAGLELPFAVPDLAGLELSLSHEYWPDQPSYAEHVAALRPTSGAFARSYAFSCTE